MKDPVPGFGGMSSIGIYIHVPYCRRVCPYCDFNRVVIAGNPPDAFVEALAAEISVFEGPDTADTVFLGGGTPSLLARGQLEQIFNAVAQRFRLVDPEITIEANPDDVTEALADAWKALGINRVSLGVQSFDDAPLEYLGRRHNARAARRACDIVAGHFENWSMDLIYGALPCDTWEETLRECAALAPPHVSCYGLTYEPETPFGARADEAIDDDVALACFRASQELLPSHTRYEISNFAIPGRECRHNLHYWRNEEYAGFGPGAYSFVAGVRSMNEESPNTYIREPGRKSESLCLSEREVALETLIQHFRLREGLGLAEYAARFGRDLFADFGPVLEPLLARGLIERRDGRVRPTWLGFELNDEIGLALVG